MPVPASVFLQKPDQGGPTGKTPVEIKIVSVKNLPKPQIIKQRGSQKNGELPENSIKFQD